MLETFMMIARGKIWRIHMEWTESLKKTIAYIEEHLVEQIDINELARTIAISPFYLQKGFKVMTDITIGEYIRNRRLYLAALDLISGKEKVIDIALKYDYDTPESFSKAFSRFHGISPMQLKGDSSKIRPYLPLKISISIIGGSDMDYVVEKMEAFQVIGFNKRFAYDGAYEKIPQFWAEFCSNYCMKANDDAKEQKVVEDCMIGEFGVCIDEDENDDGFDYMIAGTYHGGEVPKNMVVYEIPAMEWAKFRCVGPMPGALQTVNTQIFKEWLPGNSKYEFARGINLEWYANGDTSAIDYESGIWIPVKRK